MVVYVFGIPLSVFLALKANKKYLYIRGVSNDELQRHNDVVDEFGTLYLQYEPEYWYWEVTVIIKKMLLTGAMTIVAPGSSAQLAIALMVVLVNMLGELKISPFADETDDYLSFLTSFQMLVTLLAGLLLMTDDPTDAMYDPDLMGVTLVVVNSFGFIALTFSLIALHPKCRKRLNARHVNALQERKSGGNATKVVPMQQEMEDTTLEEVKSWGGQEDKRVAVENDLHFNDWGTDRRDSSSAASEKTVAVVKESKLPPAKKEDDMTAAKTSINIVTESKLKRQATSKQSRQELRELKREFGSQSVEYQAALKNM